MNENLATRKLDSGLVRVIDLQRRISVDLDPSGPNDRHPRIDGVNIILTSVGGAAGGGVPLFGRAGGPLRTDECNFVSYNEAARDFLRQSRCQDVRRQLREAEATVDRLRAELCR